MQGPEWYEPGDGWVVIGYVGDWIVVQYQIDERNTPAWLGAIYAKTQYSNWARVAGYEDDSSRKSAATLPPDERDALLAVAECFGSKDFPCYAP